MNMMTDMAVSNIGQNNIDNEKTKIRNLSQSKDSAQKEKELRSAAEGFEAIFIQKMWQQMRSSLPKNPLHHSKEEEYWQSMYDQELGKSMASAGGIGLADLMVEQLTRERYKTPQAKNLSRIRMAVNPAPLVENAQATNMQGTNAQGVNANQKAVTPAQQQNGLQPIQTKPVNTANLYEQYDVVAQNEALKNQYQANTNNQQNIQQVNAQNTNQEPKIVKTTYVTNLPPSKREHAILDKNGKPIRKPQAVETRVIQARVPNTAEYIDRSQSIGRDMRVTRNSMENTAINQNQAVQNQAMQNQVMQNQGMEQVVNSYNPVPSSYAQAPYQNAYQQVPTQAQEQNMQISQPANQDILAGINTRYVSKADRIAIERVNTILSGGKKSMYSPIEENFVAEHNAQIETMQKDSSLVALSQKPRVPSLEEALKVGTLVASLNPDEIRKIHEKQNNRKEPQIIGGGPIHTSAPIHNNVSALAPQTEFSKPIEGHITSSFGWRLDPISNKRAWHTGIDIKANYGSSVAAAKPGTVKFAGVDPELGNVVIVDHGNGIESVYGHNSEILVKKGDIIQTGMQIAKVGSSGRTNGAHLHFEIRQNGLSINPEPYLMKEKIS